MNSHTLTPVGPSASCQGGSYPDEDMPDIRPPTPHSQLLKSPWDPSLDQLASKLWGFAIFEIRDEIQDNDHVAG